MTQLRVLAICGQKQVGKNTAADSIRRWGTKKGHEIVELALAEPIKRCVADLFGFSNDQVNGDKKETPDPRWENKTPRSIIQFFGTEMMQFKLQELLPDVGRLFWCKSLIERIKALPATVTLVVITDLRFRHEYTELQKTFGERFCCVKIVCPTNKCMDDHVSEMEIDFIPTSITVLNHKPEMTVHDFQRIFLQSVKCVLE